MDSLIFPGALAPGFELADLAGRVYRLEEAGGSVLILNFWSAECPWSERVDLKITNLLPAWGEQVKYWCIASNANEPADLLRRVAAERHLPIVLLDTGQVVADLYRVETTPHLVVIDAQGRLCYQGAADDVTFRQRLASRFYLQEAVEAVLAGQPPGLFQTPAYGCALVRHPTG